MLSNLSTRHCEECVLPPSSRSIFVARDEQRTDVLVGWTADEAIPCYLETASSLAVTQINSLLTEH